ncbi:cytochrome c551 [Planomicrobium okeanokoites]|uniref:Cytochrome c551 n=1 Tax=Planomicrobium okeanokoites TaxID=244 RepID=A0ABV7KNK0_PLAOK|nr:cytochrome c [Planomicrobium okeanokoites]TAA67380.1 cytochrome c [Planomicrobium okeanokoites]
MKKSLMALLFGTTLILGACGGGESSESEPPEETPAGEESSVDAEQVVNQNCISCHGENLEGQGNFPALNDVGSRLSEDEILTVIQEGRGAMPAGIIEGEEAEAVAAWLSEQQ